MTGYLIGAVLAAAFLSVCVLYAIAWDLRRHLRTPHHPAYQRGEGGKVRGGFQTTHNGSLPHD